MKKEAILIVVGAMLAVLVGPQVLGVETNIVASPSPVASNATASVNAAVTNEGPSASEAELIALVTRINEKLKAGKTSEADLGDDLKEFDVLFAKHKDAKPSDRAHILAMKGQLYLQVLDDPEKALGVFKQIKAEFPTLQLNGNTDQVIDSLQAMVDKKKIRAALAPGTKFPDFDEKDLEGQPLSVAKYKGKVVLVDFWATWCLPCIMDLPDTLKVYEKFHDKGFEIIGVSLDEDKGKLESFVKQRKMPWPQFFDGQKWNNKLAVKYGIESTPTSFLIGPDGKIIRTYQHTEGLEEAVAKALGK